MNFFARLFGKEEEVETRSMADETGFELVNNRLVPISTISGIDAIRNSDIRKAINTIANDVSNLFINTVQAGSIVQNSQYDYLLNVRPNSIQDAKTFWFAVTAGMLINGNSYAEIIRDRSGDVVELQFLPVDSLTINLNANGTKIKNYSYYGDGEEMVFEPMDILHFKIFALDGMIGISPLKSLIAEYDLLKKANKSLASFYNRSIKGNGVVTIKTQRGAGVNREGAKALKQRFIDLNNPSSEEALGLILLEEDKFDYKDLAIDTGFLDIINNITFEQKQIAKAFDIPFEKFGIESVNSSSVELNTIYIQTALKNYLKVIESELSFKLLDSALSGTFSYDVSELTTPPFKERIESLSLAVKSSLLTVNEARKELGYAPVNGGDTIIQNAAFVDRGESYVEE